MTDIDFRLLLEKYIRYVKESEGVDFIEFGKQYGTDIEFTKEEWDVLHTISEKEIGRASCRERV